MAQPIATDSKIPGREARFAANPMIARYLSAFKTPRGVVGLVIIGGFTLAALAAPWLFPGGDNQQSADALQGPSGSHLLGTDEFGRDLLTRCIFGLRVDLSLIFAAVPACLIVGTLLGLSGVINERLGAGVQRLLDVIIGFPSLVLGLCLVAIMGAGWLPLFLTITIAGLPPTGRLARGAWLSQQNREYVLAARVLNVTKRQLLVRHVLPNALDPIIVNGAVWMVVGVYIEAGLSIVGLGVQPPTPSLGVLLDNGLGFVDQAPIYVIGPTLILLLLCVAFSLIADALNEAVNSREG